MNCKDASHVWIGPGSEHGLDLCAPCLPWSDDFVGWLLDEAPVGMAKRHLIRRDTVRRAGPGLGLRSASAWDMESSTGVLGDA